MRGDGSGTARGCAAGGGGDAVLGGAGGGVARGCAGGGVGLAWGAARVAGRWGATGAAWLGVSGNTTPHSSQNFAPARIGRWQLEQIMSVISRE